MVKCKWSCKVDIYFNVSENESDKKNLIEMSRQMRKRVDEVLTEALGNCVVSSTQTSVFREREVD